MSGKKANGGSRKAAASFSAVLLGLALMLGLLYALGLPEPLAQVKTLLLSGFSSPEAISRLLVNWAMLTLSGLSVSLCWKSGLLNVGVPGQFIAGTMLSRTGALLFSFPWWA